MLAPLILALAAPCPAATVSPADAPVLQLVTDFLDAEHRFDQPRLAALTTPDYAEVSPLGELDLHDAFLGFYAADKRGPAPEVSVCEPLVRRYGDTASVIARLSLDLPAPEGQPPRAVSIRVSFLAVRSGPAWKMASAQFTPIRPKGPPPQR
ncbi:nuclear transport factor 2 family protein [Sphingomonas sp. CJ20]